MHGARRLRISAFILAITLGISLDSPLSAQTPGTSGPPTATPDGGAAAQPHISALLIAPYGKPASGQVALNDRFAIVLDGKLPRPADQYVLFLNDREVTGLEPAIYTTVGSQRALVFKLVRNADNLLFWKELLGAPRHKSVAVTVGLGERPQPCLAGQPCTPPQITIRSLDPDKPAAFEFNLIDFSWLAIATLAVALVIGLVWGHARTSTTLRDNLVPQLPPDQQPYSLGRWQMAFWFVLIFACFIFLYVLLWDYNTVSTQALALMGISGATALAAAAIDVAKDSPGDVVNRALQALGLNTYEDVLRVRQEIEDRKSQIGAAQQRSDSKVEEHVKQLQQEIQDRSNILRTYEAKTAPFRSQGWLKDLTTDLNGPTVHRIQVLCKRCGNRVLECPADLCSTVSKKDHRSGSMLFSPEIVRHLRHAWRSHSSYACHCPLR